MSREESMALSAPHSGPSQGALPAATKSIARTLHCKRTPAQCFTVS